MDASFARGAEARVELVKAGLSAETEGWTMSTVRGARVIQGMTLDPWEMMKADWGQRVKNRMKPQQPQESSSGFVNCFQGVC